MVPRARPGSVSSSTFLLIAVLGCYAAVRLSRLANWYQLAAVLRFLALWFLAAFVGYGTPIYAALGLAPIALVWALCRRHFWLQLAIELAVLVGLVVLSLTPLVPLYIAVLVFVDQCITRTLFFRRKNTTHTRAGQHRIIVIAFSLLACVAVGYLCRHDALRYLANHQPLDFVQFQPQGPAQFWFAKSELTQGVYWQSRYPQNTGRCAIFFHGADSAGSMQSTARSLFKSLLMLDIRVFAVDHPGFGASPIPENSQQPDAWDPAGLTAAVEQKMRLQGCASRYVIGHSQGSTEALRLLSDADSDFDAFVVMGAGLFDKDAATDEYWYDRFHSDRRILERLRFEDWRVLRDRFYLNEAYCKDTDLAQNRKNTNHLIYLVFSNEHANLARTREQLWRCLDYPSGKWHEFDSGHYLNSARVGPFVFVSHPQVTRLARVLESELTAPN